MYVSYYLLGAALLCATYFLITWLAPTGNGHLVLALIFLPYLVLTPAIFRYSRTTWISFERWGSPGDVSMGAFEKARAQEFAKQLGTLGQHGQDGARENNKHEEP